MTEATPLASERSLALSAGRMVLKGQGNGTYDEACEAIRLLSAALSASPAPVGWKLVPIEPTEAMLEAAGLVDIEIYPTNIPSGLTAVNSKEARSIWSEMLTAAPAHGSKSKQFADMAAALRNTPAEALREAGYLDRAADMLDHLADASPAPSGQGVSGEVERLATRVAEVVEEDGGCWSPCSGCQESNEGYVSERDYPYSPLFKCQPGGGCRECGGIGVIWSDGAFLAGYGDALDLAAPAPSCAPGEVGKALGLLRDYIHAAGGDADHEAILAAALSPQGPCAPGEVERLRAALEVGDKFVRACFSAWSCGEPYHRVKTMMDRADEFQAALAALSPQGRDAKEGGE